MIDRRDNAYLTEQRYEPLPSLDQLPAWLWRRTGAEGADRHRPRAAGRDRRHRRARAGAPARAARARRRRAAGARRPPPAGGRRRSSASSARASASRRRRRARRCSRDLEHAILADARARGLGGPSCAPAASRSRRRRRAPARARPARGERELRLPRRHRRDRPQRRHGRRCARRSLPREPRLHDRPLRPVQGRRAPRSDPGPGGNHTPSVRGRAVARTLSTRIRVSPDDPGAASAGGWAA